MSESVERCGRLDDHGPHEWLGFADIPPWGRTVRDCPGNPVIEGGHGSTS